MARQRRLFSADRTYFTIGASRMAAQHAIPVAIAMAEMAAAERRFRAVIKLIVDAAVVRAVGPAGEILQRAVVAKPRRQLLRGLPVHADDEAACRAHFAGASGRRRRGTGYYGKCKGFYHRVSPPSLACIRADGESSDGTAIDGVSAIVADPVAEAVLRGKRMVKRAAPRQPYRRSGLIARLLLGPLAAWPCSAR